MKWVYKMSELSVDGWKEYTLNHSIERSDVKYLIVAVWAVNSDDDVIFGLFLMLWDVVDRKKLSD